MISKQLLVSTVSWSPQVESIKVSPSLSELLLWVVTAATLSNPGALHPLYPEKKHVPVEWTSYGVSWWLCGVPCRVTQAGPQTTACVQYCSCNCKVTGKGMSSCRKELERGGSSPLPLLLQ